MKHIRWTFLLPALCLGSTEVRAQAVAIYNVYGIDAIAFGGKLDYTRVRGKSGLSLSIGGFGGRGHDLGPIFSSRRIGVFEQTTVIYAVQPPPPPLIVLVPAPRPPRILLDDLGRDGLPRELWEGRAPPQPPPAPPDNRLPPPRPMPPEQLKPPKEEKPKEEKPKEEKPRPEAPKPPVREPELPPFPQPEVDPVAENARLVALGKQAFATLQYGRAAERFRQATRAAPQLPQAHFLLAQALVALGKYRDAVEAINAGMALQPDWPTLRFQPLELYGVNVADYSEHLLQLDATLTRHPGDPVLLFLNAYQLWFDGRKDEARLLFRRVPPGTAGPGVVERFLRAAPGGPVL
jgi:hypothetical protein